MELVKLSGGFTLKIGGSKINFLDLSIVLNGTAHSFENPLTQKRKKTA
jgi:hypothetical protein